MSERVGPAPASLSVDPGAALVDYLWEGLRARTSAGDAAGAIEVARRIRAALAAPRTTHRDGGVANLHLKLAAFSLAHQGIGAAVADLYAAAQRAEAGADARTAGAARERLALLHAAQGSLREADATLRRAGATTSRLAVAVRSLIAVERDDDAGSLLDAAEKDGALPASYWPLLMLGRVRHQMARGDAAAVLDTVAVARASFPVVPGTFADAILAASRARALAHMGLVSRAMSEITDPALLQIPELIVVRARAEALLGASVRAVALLSDVIADPDAGPIVRAEALLLTLWVREKKEESRPIVETIRALCDGEGLLRVRRGTPAELANFVWPGEPTLGSATFGLTRPVKLRKSEHRVLVRLAGPGGLSDIADTLGISLNTVKTHVRAIYRKLETTSRESAVERAAERGLLDASDLATMHGSADESDDSCTI